jgi:polyisoprenoid-binding protein YceI
MAHGYAVSGMRQRATQVVRAGGLGFLLALATLASFTPATTWSQAAHQAAVGDAVFQLDRSETKVNFILGATMHTVHGTFQASRGRVEFSSASGALRGEIVVDAASGESGNASRDRKMHSEVLESEKYPAITFRPDRMEGTLAATGDSTVQVHGIFSIHGAEHEMTVPAHVQINGGHWTASSHFSVPFVQWGMKNPSAFVFRVNQIVDLELNATGTLAPPSGS